MEALNKLTELFLRKSVEKSFRRLVNKDGELQEKAKAFMKEH